MRFFYSLFLISLACGSGFAAQDEAPQFQPASRSVLAEAPVLPRAVAQQGVEAIVPQLILGGEWSSVLKLTNRSGRTITATNIFFVDNNGNPMRATLQTGDGRVYNDTV